MIAVVQVISLGQFVERFVFDAPAPVSGMINHFGDISVQFGAGAPDPETAPGFLFFVPAPHALLHPLFFGTDDPDRLAIFLAELEVFDFPQLHLPLALLIAKDAQGFWPWLNC